MELDLGIEVSVELVEDEIVVGLELVEDEVVVGLELVEDEVVVGLELVEDEVVIGLELVEDEVVEGIEFVKILANAEDEESVEEDRKRKFTSKIGRTRARVSSSYTIARSLIYNFCTLFTISFLKTKASLILEFDSAKADL